MCQNHEYFACGEEISKLTGSRSKNYYSSQSAATLSIYQNIFKNRSQNHSLKKYIFKIALSKKTFQKIAPSKNMLQNIFPGGNLQSLKINFFLYFFLHFLFVERTFQV